MLGSLLIRAVDYHFHDDVMVLPYCWPTVDFDDLDKKRFSEALARRRTRKLRADSICERIYDRIHLFPDAWSDSCRTPSTPASGSSGS